MTDYSHIVPESTDGTPALVAWRVPVNMAMAARLQHVHFLGIDESDNPVWMGIEGRYDGCGVLDRVWNGRERRYYFPESIIDDDRLRKDLEDGGKIAALIDRVRGGFNVRWNGERMIGELSADAEEADAQLRETLDGWTYQNYQWEMWDAGDWLDAQTFYDLGLRLDMSEDEIASIAADIDEQARQDNVLLANTEDVLSARIEAEQNEPSC